MPNCPFMGADTAEHHCLYFGRLQIQLSCCIKCRQTQFKILQSWQAGQVLQLLAEGYNLNCLCSNSKTKSTSILGMRVSTLGCWLSCLPVAGSVAWQWRLEVRTPGLTTYMLCLPSGAPVLPWVLLALNPETGQSRSKVSAGLEVLSASCNSN